MKITFLRLSPYLLFNVPHPQDVSPLIDVGYMASILEAQGHNVEFIDAEAFKFTFDELAGKLSKAKADVIGIATMTPTAEVALQVAQKLKETNKDLLIFLFGQHASVLPETFLYRDSPVDFCVIGEPELTVSEAVEKISQCKDFRKVDGIAFFDIKTNQVERNRERKLIENLDKLPFPKHEIFLNDAYKIFYPVLLFRKAKWGFMESSRGCPYACIYCSPTLRMSFGSKYRGRSPGNVVDEMEFLVSTGVNVIYFLDDVFTFDKKRVLGICAEIIRRNLKVKWLVQARFDHLDGEMLSNMREAGCTTLCLGVESGSDRILKILEKSETLEQIKSGHKLAKEHGFLTVCFFMLGCPTETREEIEGTFQLCKKLGPDMIQVAYYTPYPGSKAFKELGEKEKISFTKYSHYNELTHNFSNVSTKELVKLQKSFYRRYFLTPKFFIKYAGRRIPYLLFNFKSESKLILESLRFLFKK